MDSAPSSGVAGPRTRTDPVELHIGSRELASCLHGARGGRPRIHVYARAGRSAAVGPVRDSALLGTASTDFDVRAARDRFLALLDEPPVSGLVSALTKVPDDAAWSKRAAHDSAFDAILTSGFPP